MMSALHALAEYKNRIINLLYRNENFITLIDPTPSESSYLDVYDVLSGGTWIIDGEKIEEQGYVFDHDFVTDVINEEKTFVFVETDVPNVDRNMFLDFNLYICIFTKKNLVRLNETTHPTPLEVMDMGYFATSSYANRIDALAECIDDIMNDTNELRGLGSVKPARQGYVSMYRPNNQYYGKSLHYHITGYNSGGDRCGNR